jgi:hypothetical protein
MARTTGLFMDVPHVQKLRAPSGNREFLVVPPFADLVALAQSHASQLAGCPAEIGGVPRSQLAFQARKELLQAAVEWTQRYDESAAIIGHSDGALPTVYMTGHQPELFHPGVWFKNAVLHQAAAIGNAVAIHLIVDNDTMKSSFVRVLGGDPEHPQVVNVPLDGGPSGAPYEDRLIHDRSVFDSFGRRVRECIAGMVRDPIIDEFWPIVQKCATATQHLGDVIARGRHLYEKRWGWRTLQVPQSVVCEQMSFLRLVVHLCSDYERFREIHNRAIRIYRRVHRLRSKSHPFPELQHVNEWCEIPLWTWTTEEPLRRRVFVRRTRNVLEITDGTTWIQEVPGVVCGSFDTFVSWWRDQARKGRRIRSRAVITTLWARLCLSDLFIHGIGGAKYDRVTDEIIRDFFQCEPPGYCTATATLQLPVPSPRIETHDISRLRQLIREIEFHPERFISLEQLAPPQREVVEDCINRKWQWIQQTASCGDARQRFLAIRECNRALGAFLASDRQQLERLLKSLLQQMASKQILTSRDWPFCIHSAQQVDELFHSFERLSCAH